MNIFIYICNHPSPVRQQSTGPKLYLVPSGSRNRDTHAGGGRSNKYAKASTASSVQLLERLFWGQESEVYTDTTAYNIRYIYIICFNN